jgi:hypothetical protein
VLRAVAQEVHKLQTHLQLVQTRRSTSARHIAETSDSSMAWAKELLRRWPVSTISPKTVALSSTATVKLAPLWGGPVDPHPAPLEHEERLA